MGVIVEKCRMLFVCLLMVKSWVNHYVPLFGTFSRHGRVHVNITLLIWLNENGGISVFFVCLIMKFVYLCNGIKCVWYYCFI